jgi:pimeloyl-ACP methyl ester carboxylesterase
MPIAHANGIEIYYEQVGKPSDANLLLISGLGAQITGWNPRFLQRLADAGFRVTTFDNRDVGQTTYFDDAGVPDIERVIALVDLAPYHLSDMAADAARLCFELEIDPVHVVGVSMGGMVAQELAINFPEVTRTLTSIMSTPHYLSVGTASDEVIAHQTIPRSEEFETFMVQELESWRVTGGSRYAVDEAEVRRLVQAAWQRGLHPEGVARQTAAMLQSLDRTRGLHDVRVPALVIHGTEDSLVTFAGGEATANALADSKLVAYEGMGHNLPEELWDDIISEIVALTQRA